MAYQQVTWGPFNCPANSTQYPTNWFTTSGGTIVSVGFQNQNLSTALSTSQIFTNAATSCHVQVVNPSSSAISWTAWAVVDTGSGGTVTATNAVVTTVAL